MRNTLHFSLFKLFVCLALLPLFCACERDHLYYGNDDLAIIRLDVDWTAVGLDPNGASVLVYNPDGTLYHHFPPFTNAYQGVISLPVGHYKVLVFNNTPEEYTDFFTFTSKENWFDYRVSALANQMPRSGNRGETVSTADELAVARILDLEITPEMIAYYHDNPLTHSTEVNPRNIIKLTPQRVVGTLRVSAHVEHLAYTQGQSIAAISGFSKSYGLGTGEYSQETATYEFILNNRVYDADAPANGTITADVNVMGLCPNEEGRYVLTIYFTLINGEEYPVEVDVTDKVTSVENISLNDIVIDFDVELPAVVGPAGSGGNGDDGVEVKDWNSEPINLTL